MFEKIKNFLQKIKEYVYYHFLTMYVYKHDKFVDEKLEYLMNNVKSVHVDNDLYFIIIETVKDECFALWNCNYPYGWLSTMLYSDKSFEECKKDFFPFSPDCKKIYEKKMPSIKKMLEFRNWLNTNYKSWVPLVDETSFLK